MNHYQCGNTVYFECSFYDLNKELIDPDLIKFIIYDNRYNLIKEEIIAKNPSLDIGEFQYDYTIPNDFKNKQILIYEWNAEINGKPSIARDSFIVSFLGDK
jgi:hypothetical protein